MKTLPRCFRPHEVKLLQKLPENSNGVAEERVITLSHVKADPTYGIQQAKRGIKTDDKIVVYIELADYTAYDASGRILLYGNDFTLQTNDTLMFRDDEYSITGVNEVLLNSSHPIRLEVIAK